MRQPLANQVAETFFCKQESKASMPSPVQTFKALSEADLHEGLHILPLASCYRVTVTIIRREVNHKDSVRCMT